MGGHATCTLTVAASMGLLAFTLGSSPAPARPRPLSDVDAVATTDHFVGAAACAPCHDRLETTYGEELSLVAQWQTSMMAHSFVDPFWQAKVRSEMIRIPALAAAIEAKCATCHAPMATTEAVKAGEPVAIFDGGFVDPDHPLHEIALEGVGCTLCHQIQDTPDLGTPAAASGHYSIADAWAPDGRRTYGQYPAPFVRPMVGSVDYLPVEGAHVHESAVCATCHDLETDYVDAEGTVVSDPDTLFPEQMPYTEWLSSDFGPDGELHTSCQTCHMTTAGEALVARRPLWLEIRSDVSRHAFPTENTTMLSILDRFADELGISGAGLDEAADAGRAYLATAARLEVLDSTLEDDRLEVTVGVLNLTGHKLPTSIPLRRVYLHTTVREPSGALVFESGRLEDDHRIAGIDADADPLAFEPHHDVITSPDEVQVYEGVLRTFEGDITFTLLRAAGFLKDNRIQPLGLDPVTAPERIASVGDCLADADFQGGSDTVTYRLSGFTGARYLVEVELRDQPIAYPFVRDLVDDPELADDPYVARFARMLAATPAGSEIIAVTSVDVRR